MTEEIERRLDELDGDPAAQARLLAREIETAIGRQSVYAERRRAILQEMRKTKTAQQIADEVGISRARVYQILRSE